MSKMSNKITFSEVDGNNATYGKIAHSVSSQVDVLSHCDEVGGWVQVIGNSTLKLWDQLIIEQLARKLFFWELEA